MDKYIIVELIPTSIKKEKGVIIQLSALKIDNLKLIDRFDYRLKENKIIYPDLINLINYDRDMFKYVDDDKKIMKDFKKWIEDFPLLIIDNEYTKNYLEEIKNQKISILDKLDLKNHDYVIEEIIKKYNLKPSNYIVDLLFEALIYESNNKIK